MRILNTHPPIHLTWRSANEYIITRRLSHADYILLLTLFMVSSITNFNKFYCEIFSLLQSINDAWTQNINIAIDFQIKCA